MRYLIVANLSRGYPALAAGARVYLCVIGTPSEGASCRVIAKSRGGRWLQIWVRSATLRDIRVAPTHVDDAVFRHDVNEALMNFDDKKTAREMVDMLTRKERII